MKSFYRKIYVILCLSGAVTVGLLYLILAGKTETLASLGKHDFVSTATPSIEATTTPTSTNEPSSEPVVTSNPETTEEPENYDTSSNDSLYRIVNKTHTIEDTFVPSDLVEVDVPQLNTVTLRSEAANALESMFSNAENDDIDLYAISGYRSYDRQVYLQDYYINEYGDEEAYRIDCIPGSSEHQLGLAVDIGETSRDCELQGCFAYSDAYSWLKENAHLYGFIERYPEGKEDITGIKYSPWNYRYVGVELANQVYESGLTLEEYFDLQ